MSDPLKWTLGNWVVLVNRAGHSESVTFDQRAEVENRVYSIKQQDDGSWVVIRSVGAVETHHAVCDSEAAARQQAKKWEQGQSGSK